MATILDELRITKEANAPKGYIYLIRNLVNGKGYVGKTEKSVANVSCRLLCASHGHQHADWHNHKREAKHDNFG